MCYKSPIMHVKQNKPKSTPRWIPTAKSLDSRNIDEPLTMHKKLSNPRTSKKWVPTGRMFKVVGLKWVPTGKVLTNVNALVDHETPKGLDTVVTNPYICDQVCDVSAGSPYSVAGTSFIHYMRKLEVWRPKVIISPASRVLQCQC